MILLALQNTRRESCHWGVTALIIPYVVNCTCSQRLGGESRNFELVVNFRTDQRDNLAGLRDLTLQGKVMDNIVV